MPAVLPRFSELWNDRPNLEDHAVGVLTFLQLEGSLQVGLHVGGQLLDEVSVHFLLLLNLGGVTDVLLLLVFLLEEILGFLEVALPEFLADDVVGEVLLINAVVLGDVQLDLGGSHNHVPLVDGAEGDAVDLLGASQQEVTGLVEELEEDRTAPPPSTLEDDAHLARLNGFAKAGGVLFFGFLVSWVPQLAGLADLPLGDAIRSNVRHGGDRGN